MKNLQAMRGVSLIVAVTTVAELGDLKRFESPATLMAFLGLVPSESSSGQKVKRGSITKTGNGHVPKALIEGSHAYRMKARLSPELHKRQEVLSQAVQEIAWKAQVRLCKRYRQLAARGVSMSMLLKLLLPGKWLLFSGLSPDMYRVKMLSLSAKAPSSMP